MFIAVLAEQRLRKWSFQTFQWDIYKKLRKGKSLKNHENHTFVKSWNDTHCQLHENSKFLKIMKSHNSIVRQDF